MSTFVLGLDFGSDSVRALVVDTADGRAVASSVAAYSRWSEGRYCNPSLNQYRQHPLDYLEAMEKCVREACAEGLGESIVGISVDTTASTPVLVDSEGTPLSLKPQFAHNPDAMFVLWKDHTSVLEADRINEVCSRWETDYRKYSGGRYSCEWAWAKVLHVLKSSPELQAEAFSWVEECDWITAVLSGNANPRTIARSRCAAGHKALWSEEWGGLPESGFFHEIDPVLDILYKGGYEKTFTGGTKVGTLCPEMAARLSLPEGIGIGIGAVDCHVGAVGAGIAPGIAVKVMGTSTCDICVAPYDEAGGKVVKGICGQVDGSVLPGMTGFEAGQAAFGDVYAWLSRFTGRSIASLSEEAAALPLRCDDIVALDWFNGRRTPDEDARVKATIDGLTLSSSPAQVFKALVEATAFGSRAIRERYVGEGVRMEGIIAVGGIARKSPYVMQTLCDVLGVDIDVPGTDQACALGAAMFASVAAGVYGDTSSAQKNMCSAIEVSYHPDMARHAIYDSLYDKYKKLASR